MPAHLLAVGAAIMAAASPVPALRSYDGPAGTSGWSEVAFDANRTHVQGWTMWWQADCARGRRLRARTDGPGGWVLHPFRYRAQVRRHAYRGPGHGPVVGRFRVSRFVGRFTSPITAAGTWRASARVFRRGRLIDRCRSGTVRWQAGTLARGTPSPLVVGPQTAVAGGTLADWQGRGWQWMLANETLRRGAAPVTAACTTAGQHGPVWFLDAPAYDRGQRTVTTCDIPAGRYLALTDSAECSTVEPSPFHATTDSGLRACALRYVEKSRLKWSLAIDGRIVSPAGYAVTSPAFDFSMPPRRNYLGLPGVSGGRGAADGPEVLLGPLSPGPHVIAQVVHYRYSLPYERLYHLTVSG
jgi:hypothetical protein